MLARVNDAPEEFVPFVSLFNVREGRLGVIVTFLALMELIRERSGRPRAERGICADLYSCSESTEGFRHAGQSRASNRSSRRRCCVPTNR